MRRELAPDTSMWLGLQALSAGDGSERVLAKDTRGLGWPEVCNMMAGTILSGGVWRR